MENFVKDDSIVREIWGKSDTILFIFAGAAAEFALNKAVDWLYFTGKLPSDPLRRLFSTVGYARRIVFSTTEQANASIDIIHQIHGAVEAKRGMAIPDWAYRDVLFMLIHYSIAAYELLERKLTDDEKEEVYDVFYRVGLRMQLKELPDSYSNWLVVRESHLKENLQPSDFTKDLFVQYKKHLGAFRFALLLEAQRLVVPQRVKNLLGMRRFAWLAFAVPVYGLAKWMKVEKLIKRLLLPAAYREQIQNLDVARN